MKLIRIVDFPAHMKHIRSGPVPGGFFWAAKHHHDMYIGTHAFVEADLCYILKHARVWIQDARKPGTWKEIFSTSDLPRFRTIITDDYDRCAPVVVVTPFLPEFYVVPQNTFRGQQLKKKCLGLKGVLKK